MSDASVAAKIRNRVLHSRDRFWRPDDFDGSPAAVSQALSRLARTGDIRRVRRGLYWRGASTALGMAPPPPDRLVDEVIAELGCGPAGRSAALVLGLSTQVPRYDAVAVVGRAPRNPGNVRFVSRHACAKRRDERLRPPEVALLEVLRDWDDVVDAPTEAAIGRIADLADRGALRLNRIVRASETEPPRVRERLRRLLLRMGEPHHANLIRPARSPVVADDAVLPLAEPSKK